jgi:hypothetical protein
MWEGSLPDPTKTYTYQVVAVQGDGKMGTTTADYKTPTMEPTHFTATAIAPGQVRFEWDDIENQFEPSLRTNSSSYPKTAGPITYFLSGPGAGTGLRIPSAPSSVLLGEPRNTFTLTGVPAGTQTWTLTVDWDPGGVLTPSTSWTKASATVVPDPLPRYRLVALGFKAIQQTNDVEDAHDGHADEVYLSAIVNQTKLTGIPIPVTKPANLTLVMTRPHGDEAVSVPYGRIKAGTALAAGATQSTGGIQSGDLVPANLDPAGATGTLQKLTFPILIWEGTLGDSDVVIVHPTLWEDDVNPIAHAAWSKVVIDYAASGYVVEPNPYSKTPDWAKSTASDPHTTAMAIYRLNTLANTSPAGITSLSNGLTTINSRREYAGSPVLACPPSVYATLPLWPYPCLLQGSDRPIGLEAWSKEGATLKDRVVVITRASAAAALSGVPFAKYASWPKGTFSIVLDDVLPMPPEPLDIVGSYELFMRLEKVP